ncbi:hypothetical protein SPHINGO8AM_30195 [Sphingomonas sp. 8AM]|nr:hypothetical protein SPHINGO8AM_30195 [Sphingomonas sp. 8AM]
MIFFEQTSKLPTITGIEGFSKQDYLPRGRRNQFGFDHAHPVKARRKAINRTHCFGKAGIFRQAREQQRCAIGVINIFRNILPF